MSSLIRKVLMMVKSKTKVRDHESFCNHTEVIADLTYLQSPTDYVPPAGTITEVLWAEGKRRASNQKLHLQINQEFR
jgi:hypothetical protein